MRCEVEGGERELVEVEREIRDAASDIEESIEVNLTTGEVRLPDEGWLERLLIHRITGP